MKNNAFNRNILLELEDVFLINTTELFLLYLCLMKMRNQKQNEADVVNEPSHPNEALQD